MRTIGRGNSCFLAGGEFPFGSPGKKPTFSPNLFSFLVKFQGNILAECRGDVFPSPLAGEGRVRGISAAQGRWIPASAGMTHLVLRSAK